MAAYIFEETHAWDNMPADYEATDYICTGCDTLREDLDWTDKPEPEIGYSPCTHPDRLLAYGTSSRGPGESYTKE